MIRCRGAAFWSIVENFPERAKISHKLKKNTDMFNDTLAAMVYMGDSEVGRENRHGIAEDQVITSVEDPLLAFREIIQAEETSALVSVFFIYVGRAALDPSRIVLEPDRKSFAKNFPFLDTLECFASFPKILPGLLLFR
jgi:hypothetical protein